MGAGDGPSAPGEAGPRRIAIEVLAYVLLVVAVGAAFVALRVRRVGTRVLDHDPHGPRTTTHDGDVR